LSASSTCTAFTKVGKKKINKKESTSDPSANPSAPSAPSANPSAPVSDVFHTGSPDTALWEFKHGAGSFKRGDLVGLREIKRRASRHALIHRESFSAAAQQQAAAAAAAAAQAQAQHQAVAQAQHQQQQQQQHNKAGPPAPGTPADPAAAEAAAAAALDHSLYDLFHRVARIEESHALLSARCQALTESLVKCHQVVPFMIYIYIYM
jgi:hypothetical protein